MIKSIKQFDYNLYEIDLVIDTYSILKFKLLEMKEHDKIKLG